MTSFDGLSYLEAIVSRIGRHYGDVLISRYLKAQFRVGFWNNDGRASCLQRNFIVFASSMFRRIGVFYDSLL